MIDDLADVFDADELALAVTMEDTGRQVVVLEDHAGAVVGHSAVHRAGDGSPGLTLGALHRSVLVRTANLQALQAAPFVLPGGERYVVVPHTAERVQHGLHRVEIAPASTAPTANAWR